LIPKTHIAIRTPAKERQKIETRAFLAVHEPVSAQYPPEQQPVLQAECESPLDPQSSPLHRFDAAPTSVLQSVSTPTKGSVFTALTN
jgi:hypothetical protein